MPLRIFNNLNSVVAQNSLTKNNSKLGNAIGRIVSGNRLSGTNNNAADKAISELINSDARTLRQSARNINDGISLINIAEGGLKQHSGILIRLREILTLARGTLKQTERDTLQLEVDNLRSEFNRISEATEFSGLKILDGSLAAKVTSNEQLIVAIGLSSDAEGQINLNTALDIKSVDTTNLGLNVLSTATAEGTSNGLAGIESSLNTINLYRAALGATQSRLTRALYNLNVSIENLTAAASTIKDTNIAEEVTNLTKQQLLVQSSAAMVGQANLIPEGVLLLLQ